MNNRLFTLAQLEAIALVLENEAEFYEKYMRMKTSPPKDVRDELRSKLRYFQTSFDPEVARRVMEASYEWISDREILRRYFDERYDIQSRRRDQNLGSREITDTDLPRLFSDRDTQPTPVDIDQPHQPPETPKEPIMSTTPIQVTTKTLVNGQDVANMSDASIYELIAAQEAKIKELEAIENKPKKLTAEIAKRKEGIAALVTHLDAQA